MMRSGAHTCRWAQATLRLVALQCTCTREPARERACTCARSACERKLVCTCPHFLMNARMWHAPE
eukprot:5818940-Alexandrium_andersonii.AAC.1